MLSSAWQVDSLAVQADSVTATSRRFCGLTVASTTFCRQHKNKRQRNEHTSEYYICQQTHDKKGRHVMTRCKMLRCNAVGQSVGSTHPDLRIIIKLAQEALRLLVLQATKQAK